MSQPPRFTLDARVDQAYFGTQEDTMPTLLTPALALSAACERALVDRDAAVELALAAGRAAWVARDLTVARAARALATALQGGAL